MNNRFGTATNVIEETPKTLVCNKRHNATNVMRDKHYYIHNKATNVLCDKHHMATNVIYATNITSDIKSKT